jgi:putative DNA primase/helicase
MTTSKTKSVRFSTGETAYDNAPKQREVDSFDEFEKFILANRSARKGTGYFCGPLALGPHDDPIKYPSNGHYRLKKHALPRTFLATDEDGYVDVEAYHELFDLFKQFRGFGYTTRKHQANAPRTRAVFELSRPVDRDEGKMLGEALGLYIESKLGPDRVKLDGSVYRNEQPVFAPGIDAEAFHFAGKPIDVDCFLLSHPPGATKTTSKRATSAFVTDANSCGLVSKDIAQRTYARLKPHSLEKVLGLINCDNEPEWFEVACALARAYCEDGRYYFERFSRGDYRGKPYPTFDQAEVNAKYDRALRELAIRPVGYGIRHLVLMAGLQPHDVDYDGLITAPTTPTSPTFEGLLMRGKRPQQIEENLKAVLDQHGVVARYNQVEKNLQVTIPGVECISDELENVYLSKVTDLAIKAGMTAARIPELTLAIAVRNVYCPVQTYIGSKPWDGLSRFEQFVSQMEVSQPQLARWLVRKWLIQAVAAVFEPNGIANAGVLVLTGKQSLGKTRLFKDLASGVPETFLEGTTLDPANRDSVMAVIRHWIVELGELDATFRKSDLAQLKAFITRQEDVLRRPYAQKESSYRRRTVFAGTVNDHMFLHDLTGNRRFWTLDVQAIHRDATIDYQQLWAEVKTWYDAKETWHLNTIEIEELNRYSEPFLALDPVVERLLARYDFSKATQWEGRSMIEICQSIDLFNPTKANFMQLASAIRKYNGNQAPRMSHGIKKHMVPIQPARQPESWSRPLHAILLEKP